LFAFGVLRSCRFSATLVVLTRHGVATKKDVEEKMIFAFLLFFACFGGRLMLEFEMSWHGSEKTKRFRDATGVAAKRYEEKKRFLLLFRFRMSVQCA
jgi:hypothetical protein